MQIMRQLFENMKGAPEEEEYKQRNKPESFLDCDKTKWIQQMKIWLMKQGLPLTESYKKRMVERNCTGKNIVVCRASDRLSGSFKRDRRK